MDDIRNFVIIAHIDHGKSTLADRFLELTGTVEKRKMREQLLDSMDLERERGITIKMQPVRMIYHPKSLNSKPESLNNLKSQNPKKPLEIRDSKLEISNSEYILNLIDTPGHADFSYEVSRALYAVEGAILLVDASQGVEAQTISVLDLARALNLKIIPAVNKVDLPGADIKKTKAEIQKILNTDKDEIFEVSGKTGEGVESLLKAVVEKIPPPLPSDKSGDTQNSSDKGAPPLSALVFDFDYSLHQGVIAYVRVFSGTLRMPAGKNDKAGLVRSGAEFQIADLGIFSPERVTAPELRAGEIGYVATNIKDTSLVKVGDTLTYPANPAPALSGYREPQPVVWISVYPVKEDDFSDFKKAVSRLHLSDTSFSFEEESSGVLGRGMRLGFLGMLHLEIVLERLKREFGINVVAASPTVTYRIQTKGGEAKSVFTPSEFPDKHEVVSVSEQWVLMKLILPSQYLSAALRLIQGHEGGVFETVLFGEDRILVRARMPLRELMREFFDELKSATSGYASLSYELDDWRDANVVRLDLLVHGESVPAFSRVVAASRLEREARDAVEKLYSILPRELFSIKIQASALGRIIASRTLSALKKDVTGYLYGGDRTRKMKLWSKQKKGKKRLKERGNVDIPHDVFVKMIRRS